MTVRFGAVTVDWLGLGTVRLEGQTGVVIYIDPAPEIYSVLDEYDARDGDLILVSHASQYDPRSIDRVAHSDAIVAVHDSVDVRQLDWTDERPEDLPYTVERVGSDESYVLGPLDLFTTPARTDTAETHGNERATYATPSEDGCGFAVTIDGVSAFYPGITDALALHEEMDTDLFLPPIGGTVTMDRHDAAALAEAIEPDLVLPVHYDTFEAIETDERAFVVDVATRGIPVVLDEQ
ncbi:MBL fold metallo-hydrolase [Natrialbaceae archaeon A-arb3/5]